MAAAAPTGFRLVARGVAITAKVCSMPGVSPLEPPGDQHHTVCWVDSRYGVAPGASSGTSFILGHSWAEDRHEVLNPVSSRATAQIRTARSRTVDGVRTYPVTALDGAVLTLRTPRGVLRYQVRASFGVAKPDLQYLRHLWDPRVRDRVVLITCAERNGRDVDDNVVLESYLISSHRLR